MIFIDHYDSSLLKKSVFIGCILTAISFALGLMFPDLTTSNTWLKQHQLAGDTMGNR